MKIEKGVRLWNRAKRIIPGGSQLLSKRSEMFLPDQWPSYYAKAKGITVWDLDGNKFLDFSYMGIGCCILGYADPDVNRAVGEAIARGNMTTLNCPEEVELAELLLTMHPWAHAVRYARTGGEAMALAARIGRAASGKDTIAFCGYHGWHDWYLSANLADDKNLDGHLLPGLKPLGVPRALKGSMLPFTYNKIDELEDIVKRHDIGVIVVEPIRHHYPKDDFLKKVASIARKIKAVLVFDEITSGFRMTVGGAYTMFAVVPDIVVYAKGISNGYPMAAIIGRKKIMSVAEESFVSSTYWTERIGSVAALATIKKMKRKNVPRHLIKIGKFITAGWEQLAEKHGLRVETMGIPPLTTLAFNYGKDSQALHTLFTQEMLARGYLAAKAVYVSLAHTERDVKNYLKVVDEVFAFLKKAVDSGKICTLLKGPVAHAGFRRLT